MIYAILKERVVLDASTLEPFEIFAKLRALLCFPNATPEGRDRIARAICADILDQQCKLEPDIDPTLRALFPEYQKSNNRVSLASHGRLWDDAFIAGKYFLSRVKHAATGHHPILDGVATKMSGQKTVMAMFPPWEGGFEINYESRLRDIRRHQIQRYYPVADLAAAFQAAAHVCSPQGFAAEFSVHNLELFRAVVKMANVYAECIRRTPGMENVAAQLIELEWRD